MGNATTLKKFLLVLLRTAIFNEATLNYDQNLLKIIPFRLTIPVRQAYNCTVKQMLMKNLKWIAPALAFAWITLMAVIPSAHADASKNNTGCILNSDCDKCGEKDCKAECCKPGSKKKAKKNCCKASADAKTSDVKASAKGCCSGAKEAHMGCGGHTKADVAAPAEKNPAPTEK